jgi:uncharacterized protein (TIGR00255 family)
MTGYGRGEAETEDLRVGVDVRTVNHRHLDVDVRGSLLPPAVEVALKKLAARRLSRGKCELVVTVRAAGEAGAGLVANEPLLRAHFAMLRRLKDELALAGEVGLDHLSLVPWNRAFELEEPRLGDDGESAVLRAVDAALDAVVESRQREGRELRDDLSHRLAVLRSLHARVREESAGIAEAQLRRIRGRMEALCADAAIDEQRLAQEAALLADRSDVAEEVTRFEAYLERLATLLDADGPQGKRLDFILQEALREANTMGAKARGLWARRRAGSRSPTRSST